MGKHIYFPSFQSLHEISQRSIGGKLWAIVRPSPYVLPSKGQARRSHVESIVVRIAVPRTFSCARSVTSSIGGCQELFCCRVPDETWGHPARALCFVPLEFGRSCAGSVNLRFYSATLYWRYCRAGLKSRCLVSAPALNR